MKYWITPDGNYYEGLFVADGSIEVPERPSELHVWDGEAWVADADLQAAANIAAIQAELDRQAQLKGYDSILSACSYAAQPPVTVFQEEGAAFLKWRSDSWAQAYAVLDDVKAGKRAMPTPEESVAMMPALVLP